MRHRESEAFRKRSRIAKVRSVADLREGSRRLAVPCEISEDGVFCFLLFFVAVSAF